MKYLSKKLVLCFILGTCLDARTVLSSDRLMHEWSPRKELLKENLEEIVRYLEELQQKDARNLFIKRKAVSTKIRKKLMLWQSPLSSFPQLDEKTYNMFIKIMNKMADSENVSKDILVYLWSYITGIPIVGLMHNQAYYQKLHHLIPTDLKESVKTIIMSTSSSTLRVKMINVKDKVFYTDYPVEDDIFFSHIPFRKKYLEMTEDSMEISAICWNLLDSELVPLGTIKDKFLHRILNCILAINKGTRKPLYRLSLIRLLKNIAVYLTEVEGPNEGIVVGPCSVEKWEYCGFKDGIFINQESSEKDIHKLLSFLVGMRTFLTKVPLPLNGVNCSGSKLHTFNALFSPHYTFAQLNEKKEAYGLISKICSSAEDVGVLLESFAIDWLRYIDDPTNETGHSNIKAIKQILNYLNRHSLKLPLDYHTLETQEVVFLPTIEVNISSYLKLNHEKKMYNDDTLGNEIDRKNFIQRIKKVLQHREYQGIEKLDISNNELQSNEIVDLLSIFKVNILPELRTINLQGNYLEEKHYHHLKELLKRDTFEKIVLDGTCRSVLNDSLGRSLSKKVSYSYKGKVEDNDDNSSSSL